MRKQLLQSLLLAASALAACNQKPAPSSASMDCSATRFPTDTGIAGAMDGLAGTYENDVQSLTVRQEDYRLLVSTAGAGDRELRRIADWRFEDGCGVTYQFSLALARPDTMLEITSPDGSTERYRQIGS